MFNPQSKQRDLIPVSEFRKMKVKPEKSLSALKKDLDKVFNAYIRRRDTHNGMFKCISCGQFKPARLMHAGHYYSAGHHSAVRWDEDNVWGQCSHCNTFLHGNLVGYQTRIIERLGKERLTQLIIRKNNKSKMMQFEIKLLIDTYKAKMKA